MRYYDRNRELALLKDIQKKSFEEFSKMTVLKGRRRIENNSGNSINGGDGHCLFICCKKGRSRSLQLICRSDKADIKRICPTRNLSFQGHIRNADEYRQASIIQSVH